MAGNRTELVTPVVDTKVVAVVELFVSVRTKQKVVVGLARSLPVLRYCLRHFQRSRALHNLGKNACRLEPGYDIVNMYRKLSAPW